VRRFGVTLALIAVVGLAGCSSAGAATPTPAAATDAGDTQAPVDTSEASFATIDPCALLTLKQAEELAGARLQAAEPMGNPPTSCIWSSPATDPGIHQVEIDLGDGAKSALDIDRDQLKHAFTPLSAIGDEATAEDGAIFFRKDDEWVKLSLVTLDDVPTLPKRLQDLAKVIVGELP